MLNDLLLRHKPKLTGQAELRAQQNTTRAVGMVAGNLTTNTKNVAGGVSARVYRNGIYGFASAAEYDDDSIARVLSAAGENATFLDSRVKKGLPPLAAIKTGDFGPKKTGGDIPQKMLADFIRELDAHIADKYKNLASRAVMASCLDMEKFLVTGDGATSHSMTPRAIVRVSMTVLDDSGAPVDLGESFGGYGFFDEHFTEPSKLYEKLDVLYNHLMNKREAVFAQAGTRQCVLGPDLAGILAHEAVGHTVEADLVLGGSVAGDLMNQVVASPIVTMVDFAHTALGITTPVPVYVDDEGTIAEDAVLIENGILKSYMHDRLSAHKFGVKPTGNARAFTFSDEPLIRMRNTAILPGKDKLDDMIASVEDGYYLIKPSNGQADTTGEFMFGVPLGYEIKNGKLGKAIKDITISGVAFEMLKTVDMISDDMSWSCAGMCGKKQPIPVGMGGPAVRCKVNIGGR